jgi:hypothetical protein
LNNNKTRLAARISIARLMKSTRARRADDSLPRLLAFFPSTQSKDGLAISFFSFIITMLFFCALFSFFADTKRGFQNKQEIIERERKGSLPDASLAWVAHVFHGVRLMFVSLLVLRKDKKRKGTPAGSPQLGSVLRLLNKENQYTIFHRLKFLEKKKIDLATKRTKKYARQSQSAFCGRKTETQFERQKHCQHPFFMALDRSERKKPYFLYSRTYGPFCFIQENVHFALFKKMKAYFFRPFASSPGTDRTAA